MTSPIAFNTPARLIEYAMKDAGLLQQGDLPNSDQYAEYGNRLLDVINLWQTQGLKLWLQRDLSVPLVANQGTYSFMPGGDINMTKPLRVIQAYYLDASGNQRPLTPMSRDDYSRVSNKFQTGAVNSFFADKQQLSLTISLWNVPDAVAATGTFHPVLQYQVTNFVNLYEGVEFPQEWFMGLRWGLADDICTGQPQAIMDRCMGRALTFRQMLEDWDVEDASTSFSPDVRGNSGFR
jgi:hypothetical protein